MALLMDPENVVLHVGVPKSGTTTFQFNLFGSLPGVMYLGKPYDREGIRYEANQSVADLVASVWQHGASEYEPHRAVEWLRSGLAGRGAFSRLVLSEEALTQASGADRLEKARRLRRLFGRCRVLITIREPSAALFSGHRWLYTRCMVNQRFEGWIRSCLAYSHVLGRADDFPLRQYRYGELIHGYQRLFGADRVVVLPIEGLKYDDKRCVGALAALLGSDLEAVKACLSQRSPENVSPGVLGMSYQHRLHAWRRWVWRRRGGRDPLALADIRHGVHGGIMRMINVLDWHPRMKQSSVSELLADYFRQSNRLAAELSGWPLGELGYAA